MSIRPIEIDLKRDTALTIRWSDGRVSVYPIKLLRRQSPSADSQQQREQLATNPLTVLPSRGDDQPLTAEDLELVGNYALRLRFSDGHGTGLYTWSYLRELDPAADDGDWSQSQET